jgi:hypothetical protein
LRTTPGKALKPARIATLVTALLLSPLAYVGSAQKSEAFVVAVVVATPTVWFVRTLLFSQEAH